MGVGGRPLPTGAQSLVFIASHCRAASIEDRSLAKTSARYHPLPVYSRVRDLQMAWEMR